MVTSVSPQRVLPAAQQQDRHGQTPQLLIAEEGQHAHPRLEMGRHQPGKLNRFFGHRLAAEQHAIERLDPPASQQRQGNGPQLLALAPGW
jgi:hypothetical protein